MAIFNKSDESANNSSGTTVIANHTKISGNIEIECNLHIDGEFEGGIKSHKTVTIGKSGIVSGEILANKIIISGSFNGNIEADEIDVMSSGKLLGKVLSNELIIERGGFFEGESKKKSSASLEKPLTIESKN